jgi:hypothetical protein
VRFHPQEITATHDLLRRLLDSPDDWMKHLRQYVSSHAASIPIDPLPSLSFAGSIILKIAYGIDVQPSNDPNIEIAEKAIDGLAHALKPGSFIVDIFPFCESKYSFHFTPFPPLLLLSYCFKVTPIVFVHSGICSRLVPWRRIQNKSEGVAPIREIYG